MPSSIKTTVLSNGIVVATESMESVTSCSIGVWIDVGSRDETPERNGIAHFFEHMAFKGTPTRNGLEIVKTIESAGGQVNAFTTKEQTCFYARVVSSRTALTLEVLLDMLNNPLLDAKEMEKEREVILEELRGCDDNPDDRVHDLFNLALFGGQRIGLPIAGTVASVKKLNQTHLKKHLSMIKKQWPVFIVAAGKVWHKEVVDIVRRCTTGFSNYSGPSEKKTTRTVKGRGRVRFYNSALTENKDIQQANMILGARAYDALDSRCFPLLLLNNILGDGMSSRLFQSLREVNGLTYHINTYMETFVSSGLFGLYFNSEPGNLKKVMKTINSEFTRLKLEGVTKDELEFARENILGNFLMDMESTQNRMTFLARIKMRGVAILSRKDYLGAVKQVSLPQINTIVSELFNSKRWAIACVLPEGRRPQLRGSLEF